MWGRIVIVVAALAATACETPGPTPVDGGEPLDAWVLPPELFDDCPAECVAFCSPTGSPSCNSDEGAAAPQCHGCLPHCAIVGADLDAWDAECASSTAEPTCRGDGPVCQRSR